MYSYQTFNECYIILSLETRYSHFPEDRRYVIYFSTSGCINQQHESGCYLNSTIQVQYFNVILRKFILNNDCDHIFNNYYFDDNNFSSQYKKVIILQDLQNILKNGLKEKIVTYHYLEWKILRKTNKFMHHNMKVCCIKCCHKNGSRIKYYYKKVLWVMHSMFNILIHYSFLWDGNIGYI